MSFFHSPCNKLLILCPKHENYPSIPKPFSSKNPKIPKIEVPRISFPHKFSNTNTAVQQVSCCSSSSPDVDKEATPNPIIFIKGLAQSTSEGGLKEAFSQFGEVSRVKIINDKRTKQSLGFAYVWFTREDDAHIAVEEMNGKFLEGRFIYVTIAKPGSCNPRSRPIPYKF